VGAPFRGGTPPQRLTMGPVQKNQSTSISSRCCHPLAAPVQRRQKSSWARFVWFRYDSNQGHGPAYPLQRRPQSRMPELCAQPRLRRGSGPQGFTPTAGTPARPAMAAALSWKVGNREFLASGLDQEVPARPNTEIWCSELLNR